MENKQYSKEPAMEMLLYLEGFMTVKLRFNLTQMKTPGSVGPEPLKIKIYFMRTSHRNTIVNGRNHYHAVLDCLTFFS